MSCLLAVLQVAIKEGNRDLYNNAKQRVLYFFIIFVLLDSVLL